VSSPNISIIVRTKNEERWITACLRAIYKQTYQDFEVIIVDNNSTDKTLEKARQFPVTIKTLEKYLPGASINAGVDIAKGNYIALISAHCIPTSKTWLENLLKGFESDKVAGVYGRQEPLSFTPDTDKRDLLITFGLDKKIQWKDSFFHNANSMVRSELLKKIPFDSKVTNIEDRVWARAILKSGYCIAYQPEASVYHYHGIHQNQNNERCRNVVRIIQELNLCDSSNEDPMSPDQLEIVAIIPQRGKALTLNGKSLLEYTVSHALSSKYINRTIVVTDDKEMAILAEKLGAQVPFLRDNSLSEDYINLEQVYKYSLEKLEELEYYPDLVVTLEVTFPFRNKTDIDRAISYYAEGGFDSVVPARLEYSSCYLLKDGSYDLINDGFLPRKYKDPIYITQKGICCVTEASLLREGSLLGENVGMFEVKDPREFIEVRDEAGCEYASSLNILL